MTTLRIGRISRFAALVVFISIGASAKEPATGVPPKLVRLQVVALDEGNAPVRDLRREEVQVFENGRPQRIVVFRRSENKAQEPEPRDAHEYPPAGKATPYATVILVDMLNSAFDTRGFVWNELVRSLESLESSDWLYF